MLLAGPQTEVLPNLPKLQQSEVRAADDGRRLVMILDLEKPDTPLLETGRTRMHSKLCLFLFA